MTTCIVGKPSQAARQLDRGRGRAAVYSGSFAAGSRVCGSNDSMSCRIVQPSCCASSMRIPTSIAGGAAQVTTPSTCLLDMPSGWLTRRGPQPAWQARAASAWSSDVPVAAAPPPAVGRQAGSGLLGLPHIRFHDLRHSAATLLLGLGIHPKIVSEMLGHSPDRHHPGSILARHGYHAAGGGACLRRAAWQSVWQSGRSDRALEPKPTPL
jgi:integrase-like protein